LVFYGRDGTLSIGIYSQLGFAKICGTKSSSEREGKTKTKGEGDTDEKEKKEVEAESRRCKRETERKERYTVREK
jgi:hypothetical protein